MLGELGVHVYLFGGLRVRLPGATLSEGGIATKAATLIKLLALRPGHTTHREEVVETLWPNSDADRGANNLYKTLHHLRASIPDPGARDFIKVSRNVVRFDPSVEIDVDQFLAAAASARAGKTIDGYEAALAFSTGELLPCDIYEDWTRAARDYVHTLVQQLRFEAADLCLENHDVDQAMLHLQALTAAEPTNERAHQKIMRLFIQRGETALVSRQFDICAACLRREMDCEPSTITQSLAHAGNGAKE